VSTICRLRRGDSGQLTIMIIGFAVIVMMLVTLIANTSKAFLWRRSLSSWADAAALAATQTAGERAIFDTGLAGNLAVDEAAAEAFVLDYVDRHRLADRYPDLVLDVDADETAGVVTVTLSATMPLAFVNHVTDGFGQGVRIEGSASAAAPLG
jgi:Putative Flp pilus-assembly TadE/G-like